jgi:hypothetical protein
MQFKLNSIWSFPIYIAVIHLFLSVTLFYWGYKFQEFAGITATHAVKVEKTIREMKCDSINKETAIGILKTQVSDQEDYTKIIFGFAQFCLFISALAIYEIWRRYVASRPNLAFKRDAEKHGAP